MRVVAACLSVAFLLTPSASQGQEIRFPLGGNSIVGRCVLGPDRKVLYVPLGDGRIEALDPENGKSQWLSVSKAKPLAANSEVVFALVAEKPGVVRFAALDKGTGKTTKTSEPFKLPLPEGSLALVPGAAGKNLFVNLEQIVKPKEKVEKVELKTLLFDPSTGAIEPTDKKFGIAGSFTPGPKSLERPTDYPPAALNKFPGFVADAKYVQVHYGNNTMESFVMAFHWDRKTGKHLESKIIFKGRSSFDLITTIAGGRYVMLAMGKAAPALYSAETGEPLFKALPKNLELGSAVGTRLLGVLRDSAKGEATLQAFDVTSAKVVWSRSIASK